MKLRSALLCLLALTSFAFSAQAQNADVAPVAPVAEPTNNIMDELDPFDPNVDRILELLDQVYETETGLSAHVNGEWINLLQNAGPSCYRMSCKVYALVIKAEQRLYLYVDGRLEATWKVSTGAKGHTTPNFDTNPNGRIYTKYSSRAYPGGDYQGLGNMPYAVFISGGFAIHGTGRGNWSKLGSVASHGCVRLHPDNAKLFNSLVRENGIYNTWITVQ